MLKEVPQKGRVGDDQRRWFSDEYFDLIVWLDNQQNITGFQLCYDIRRCERVLTWTNEYGFRHERVDAGESNPMKNHTPILVVGGAFPADAVLESFTLKSSEIDEEIRAFVINMLQRYS